MRYRNFFMIFICCLALGCSDNNQSPVTPPVAPISDSILNSTNDPSLLGLYDLEIDIENMRVDINNRRQSMIGESWIVSGKSYFTSSPCKDCLKIKGISLIEDSKIKLLFSLRHPFKPGDTQKPPSAVNRLDLDIFDVALIVYPKENNPTLFELINKSVHADVLTNANGYTDELKNLLNDESIAPYVLAIDNSNTGVSTWNKFAMGQESDIDVDIHIGTNNPMYFSLYLTFGYGASATRPERLNPQYFNPEFNRKSAWKLNVTPPEEPNTWHVGDTTTPYDVIVEVYDWQHGNLSVNNPPINPNDIAFSSDVLSVSVEIPGMTSEVVSVLTPSSGTGMPDNPLRFEIPVANELSKPAGQYTGLVKVLDERTPALSVPSIDHVIHTPDGINLENYLIDNFATYQTFTAVVIDEPSCGPISGSVVSPECPVMGLRYGDTVDFVVNASSENGGDPITLYEIDIDYDGVNFTSDMSNVSGIFNAAGPFLVPLPCEDNIPYWHTVAFRATDSCVPPNVTVFATCEVVVQYCITTNPNEHMWTITWGGVENVFPTDVITDPYGNIYVCGQYQGTVDFDPDDAISLEKTSNGAWDIFVSKFDPSGKLLWNRVWGGVEWDYGSSLAYYDGNLYVCGSYENEVDFDPETSEDIRISNGYMDAFLAKYDSDGNYYWVKTWGGTRFEYCYGSNSDSFGNIYLIGSYELTVDFDPGSDVDERTAVGLHDIWFGKFDSSGNRAWTKTIGSVGGDWGAGIICDSSSNVIITGQFNNSADFDPDPVHEDVHVSNGGLDVFLAKYTSDGEYIWARHWGGGFWDYGNDVDLDSSGNIYVGGQFQQDTAGGDPIDFDPGPGEDWHTPNGYTDSFVSKFNSSGDYLYALTWGGIASDGVNDIVVAPTGDFYVAGDFTYTVDFDPGSGTFIKVAYSDDRFDSFMSRFNASGQFQWCGVWGGEENDFGISIASDNAGFIYITGRFAMTVDFDPSASVDNHTSLGAIDAYLSKFSP